MVSGVPTQQQYARQTAEEQGQQTAEGQVAEGSAEHPKVTYSKQTVGAAGDRVKIDCSVEGVDVSGVNEFSVSWSKVSVGVCMTCVTACWANHVNICCMMMSRIVMLWTV